MKMMVIMAIALMKTIEMSIMMEIIMLIISRLFFKYEYSILYRNYTNINDYSKNRHNDNNIDNDNNNLRFILSKRDNQTQREDGIR